MTKKRSRSPRSNPPSLMQHWKECKATIESRAAGAAIGVSTGYPRLDELTSGLKGVAVLGGKPGVGKTTLALRFSLHAATVEKVPVIFGAYEMPCQPTCERLTAMLAGVPALEVSSGRSVRDPSWLRETERELKRLSRRFTLLARGRGHNLDSVCRMVEAAKRKADSETALVVIDSLQRYCRAGSYAGASDKQMIDAALTEISDASADLGFDVLVISHLPKSAPDKPTEFTFSGSAFIDYEADLTMILHCEDSDPDERDMHLHILKNRYGRPGKIKMVFNGQMLTFDEY